jgi:iron complex transport system ATP-binding protein
MADFLELKHADVWRGDQRVFHDFSLSVDKAEKIAILGPNGAGKSTFVGILTGALRAAATPHKMARLFGEDSWALEDLRHEIGLIAPEETTRFEPDCLAQEVVISALRGAYGITNWMRFSKQEKQRAAEAMQLARVAELATRPYSQLSSGEKRRFLLARALIHQPPTLVLDEPTTSLDLPSSLIFIQIMRQLMQSGRGVVWITHHPSEIPPEISRVILLKQGAVFADGPKKKILTTEQLTALYDCPLRVRWSHGFCHVVPGE